MEGSDPDTSKYHKYKKKQLNSQSGEHADGSAFMNDPSAYLTPSPKAVSHNQFVFDENIPELIRKSIEQAESVEPVRVIYAPEEFKQKHFTEHTTHTEMPPLAAMSLAAALHQSGGRGAQIFQKRKAKSEKWVVDEDHVKKAEEQNNPLFVRIIKLQNLSNYPYHFNRLS